MSKNPILPPVRIGIIGAGTMGRQHALFISREENAELVGVADPVSGQLAVDYGVPYFTDQAQLLAMDNLDAVIIASPNAFHVTTALDCIKAGVASLLEKPVATSVDEANMLAAAMSSGGAPILVGHHRRHHPAVRAAKGIIDSGELGQLVAVNGMWLTKKSDSYFDQAWRREKGAGVLLINLVHDLDLLRHMCGEITSVQARTSNNARGYEVEDTASVIFEFENGALGSFIISDSVVAPWGWDQTTEDDPTFPLNPTASCYSIAGSKGSLAFPQLGHYYHSGTSDWTQPLSLRYDPRDAGDSYSSQLKHFISVARREVEPLVTVEDAAKTLALIEAVQLAAQEGKIVRIGQNRALTH
ncbi:Gfo/Idh/MocA family protein [Pseudarthrobacter sp. NPDC055928]|jgi:predicted dehydrogenase|uniref:Gfo/Idh/MocA family protein n=1 Tax=Pseudarthrobacter sp. NPDC055928 TaxID=3345661 RepID=UPI0035D6101E